MSDKKNDIIREQRKAREEFLRLKRMQNGEIEPPPKPSEVAIVPNTPKEKVDNFWFQYKWHILSIIFSVILLAILITQCSKRIDYDLKIVYYTNTPVLDAQTKAMSEYFEKYVEDINGDDEVNVQIINCSIAKDNVDFQYKNAILTKLQSIIASDEEALLFITDKLSVKFFENLSQDGLFEQGPIPLPEDFYTETAIDGYDNIEKNLQISCRRVKGTMLEKKDNVNIIYTQCQKLLAKVAEN